MLPSIQKRAFRVGVRAALLLSLLWFLLTAPRPAQAQGFGKTPLVTGNGFGFAVVPPTTGKVSKLYAHPYSFQRPDPKDELGEGIPTANLIKQMSWAELRPAESIDYVKQSHIIAVESPDCRQIYFMPFGVKKNILVTGYQNAAGNAPLEINWDHNPQPAEYQNIMGQRVAQIRFDGVDESVVVVPLGNPAQTGDIELQTKGTISRLSNHNLVALLSLEKEDRISECVKLVKEWHAGLSTQALVDRELKEVEEWRVKPTVQFKNEQEKSLFRQSEIILRMAQCQEENKKERHGHGLILACLPDGSWVNHWVRDMAYATRALIQMGHQQEARWALEAYLQARPVSKLQKDVRGLPYQISLCRYWGDGSEEPFFTMEHATNVELDDWGLVLWVLGEYVQKFHDKEFLASTTYRGTVLENAHKFIVTPLSLNTDTYKDGLIVAADTSIWEEKQKDKKHFAFSTAAAIRGLTSLRDAIAGENTTQLQQLLEMKIELLKKGFYAAYAPDKHLRGALEPGIKNEVDGAMLSAIAFGIVDDEETMRNAVADMEKLRMPSGGFRRVHSIVEDPAVFEYWYERQEFLFIDFSMAEIYLRLGQPEKAHQLISSITDKSARDHNIIPEMYVSEVNDRFKGDVGDPTGAIPIVGYGSGIYISYLYNRDELSQAK